MDRRRHPRVTAHLPVRLWGIDAYGQAFTQTASARNVSDSGAVIRGIERQILPGEVLEVQVGTDKAEFRVVWAGVVGTRRERQIGVESVPAKPAIWDLNLQKCCAVAGKG